MGINSGFKGLNSDSKGYSSQYGEKKLFRSSGPVKVQSWRIAVLSRNTCGRGPNLSLKTSVCCILNTADGDGLSKTNSITSENFI